MLQKKLADPVEGAQGRRTAHLKQFETCEPRCDVLVARLRQLDRGCTDLMVVGSIMGSPPSFFLAHARRTLLRRTHENKMMAL